MGSLAETGGADTVKAITGGFSGTVKSIGIGIVIIFGIMLGKHLDAAKDTNRMVFDAARPVGQKGAELAMAITGDLVSIPVFSDADFGCLFAEVYFKNKPESFYTFRKGAEETPKANVDYTDLPCSWASLLPLVVPIVLILSNTTCAMVLPKGSPVLAVTNFIGDSNVALAIGAVLAIAILGRRLGGKKVLSIMDVTLKDAGPIVFITAAGGALGQVLKVSDAGDSLAQLVINTGFPFVLIPFVISGLLKIVQGSGTVAVTTAATLCAPIAASLALNPILIFMASGAGARACCHVNDSYFWVYTNCMGYDMKTGMKTLSVSNVAMSLGGLAATFIAALWL